MQNTNTSCSGKNSSTDHGLQVSSAIHTNNHLKSRDSTNEGGVRVSRRGSRNNSNSRIKPNAVVKSYVDADITKNKTSSVYFDKRLQQ